MATAYTSTAHLPRKVRARAFLRRLAEQMAQEEDVGNVSSIRPPEDHEMLAEARRMAHAWVRAQMPTFMAGLPDDT